MIRPKKKQTSITSSYHAPKKKWGRGQPKKVACSSVPVELSGSNAQYQEEAPPDPAKKQRQHVHWNSDDKWPALYEAMVTRCAEKYLPVVDKGIQISAKAGCIPHTTLNSAEQHLGDLPIMMRSLVY
jgi:hypothetical protein